MTTKTEFVGREVEVLFVDGAKYTYLIKGQDQYGVTARVIGSSKTLFIPWGQIRRLAIG